MATNRTHEETTLARKLVMPALGILLLVAAGFKAYELLTGPLAGEGFFASRGLVISLVLFEILFGLTLLFGVFPRWTWRIAVAVFAVFAAVTLYKGLSGETSCGCFGRVEINPWWTFCFDLVVLAALLRWRPAGEQVMSENHGWRLSLAGTLFVLVGTPAVYLMATYEPARLTATGVIEGDGNLVILEPEKWVGQPLPVREYIDIGQSLGKGRWTLLFYHHDCPECREVVPKYEQAAQLQAEDGTQIALIEIPPYGDTWAAALPHLVHGRLSEEREWFVQTPVEITLEAGRVTGVSTELGGLQVSVERDGIVGMLGEVSTSF